MAPEIIYPSVAEKVPDVIEYTGIMKIPHDIVFLYQIIWCIHGIDAKPVENNCVSFYYIKAAAITEKYAHTVIMNTISNYLIER